ncbi:MAG: tetratricopeptide repeat protein [Saprospiraceae bacterium]
MRNLLVLVLALFFQASNPIFSQNDSLQGLQSAIETAKSGQEKSNSLNRLSDYLRRTGDLAGASRAAREAFVAAQNHDLKAEEARALDNLGQVFEAKFDYENALKSYVDALKHRESAGDQPGTALSKHRIGRVFLLQGDLDQAQPNLEKALELRRAGGNPAALAETNRALGDLWRQKKVLGKAQEFYRQAIDEKIEANDLGGAAEIAGLLGKLATDLGDYEGALVYFRQSFDLNSSTEHLPGMGRDLLNIGSALLHQQSFEEAMSAFQSAEGIFAQAKDTVGQAQSLENQGTIFVKTNRHADAEAALEKASALLAAIRPVPGVPEIYRGMAAAYREAGNLGKAYDNLLRYTAAKEQVFGFEKNKAMLELTTRYESEFAAEEQQRTIEKLELEQASTRKVGLALVGIMVFGVFALWALWKSNRQKRRDNKLLQDKNAEIDAKNRQLNEQNTRLDDLNRRLVGEVASREMLEQTAFNRDQFLAVLSREMRTPMNDILAHTRTLLAEKPRPGQADALLNIQYSANSLLVLVNDLLDYSKIEAGKIVLETVEFDLKKSLGEVEKRFAPVFREKEAGFAVEVDPKIPAKVAGDPARFSQILSNILTHAAQHTEGGDVRLNIRAMEETASDVSLKIEVNAQGILLEPAETEALAQPNLAAVEAALGERAGQVFGLVLAKRLVDLQNGQFRAATEAGTGTAFAVELPFKKAVQQSKTTVSEAERAAALEGKYILVAEDNKINQLVVQKMLQKAGAVVVTADDGVAALEAFKHGYFDLILMDIQMPKLDGYRTVAEMRQSDDEVKKNTPIIALTASAYLTDKDKAELFQMNDHIGKPFSPEELLEKVVASLTSKQSKLKIRPVAV